jgi:hypothetical protein
MIGDKGLLTYSPLVLVAVYGVYIMWHNGGEQRRLGGAIAASCSLFLVLMFLFTDDRSAGNYGERRYVDFFPLLCITLGPVLTALRSRLAVAIVRLLVLGGIVMETIGTVSPWTGNSGFFWNLDRFHTIWMHAPFIATVDVLASLALILVAMRAIAPMPAALTACN